jgi:hypothetical protein
MCPDRTVTNEFKNRHVSALIELLQKELDANGGDAEADAPFKGDEERIGLASRVLSGIASGKTAEDIELEGSKQQAEIHSTGGRPVKDADPTYTSKDMPARGDKRVAHDTRHVGPSSPHFGTGDGSRGRVDTRFSVDGVFNSAGTGGDGTQHDLASVFKPAPKLAQG